MLAQDDRWAFAAEARNEIGGVEGALVAVRVLQPSP
jgi:hypothetical protein